MSDRTAKRITRRQQLDLLAHFMSSPTGRSYIYDFLAACHVYTTSFSRNSRVMAFSEGERNTGIRLLGDIVEASPDYYLQMLKEQNDERRTAEHRNDAAADRADAASGTDDRGFAADRDES